MHSGFGKTKKANMEIRISLIDNGVFQWQLANRLRISESTMVARLRTELPDSERERYLSLIKEIRKEQEG